MAIVSRNLRVFLDGQDISRFVHAMHIEADVMSVVSVRLDLHPTVSWDADGNVHLTSGAQQGPLVHPQQPGLHVRAMDLSGLPESQ